MSAVLVLALGLAAYASVSQRVSRLPVTAPMTFVAIGAITAALGLVHLPVRGEATAILIETTLVLVLFSDAVSVDLRSLRRHAWLPLRLLVVALPLVLAVGWAMATWVLPSLTLVEAALLAALLTPTDAALGQAVVTDRRLPERIREGLSVESGLNDGIMVPVVTVLLALAAHGEDSGPGDPVAFAAGQIGFGLAAGALFGLVGGFLIHRRSLVGAISGIYRQLGTLAVPAAAYSAAELVGGNGFIAAFVSGLAFAAMTCAQCRDVADVTTDDGVLFTAIAFFVFGAAFLAPTLAEASPRHLGYAVLSLTVVRALPVLVSLVGTATHAETRLFIGWFGPRGLATILFILLVSQDLDSAGAATITTTAIVAVGASVLAHGLTAAPWAGRLARRLGPDRGAAAPTSASHRTRERGVRAVDAPHP